MWYSGGHLAVLFYIFFHHRTWCSCVSRSALVIVSNDSATRVHSSSFTGLFPRTAQKLQVFIDSHWVSSTARSEGTEEISCSFYDSWRSGHIEEEDNLTQRGNSEISLSATAEMWWFKRPFVCFQIPAPTPSVQCPNSTLSGTDIKFSGRSSSPIGLFTSVCNGRDPLLNTQQPDQ